MEECRVLETDLPLVLSTRKAGAMQIECFEVPEARNGLRYAQIVRADFFQTCRFGLGVHVVGRYPFVWDILIPFGK